MNNDRPANATAAQGPAPRGVFWLLSNDAKYNWARSRRVRRRLVVAYFALMIALVPALVFWHPVWPLPLALLLFYAISGTLTGATRGLAQLGDADLDERERGARDSVYRRIYLWVAGLALWFGLLAGGLPDLAVGARIALFFPAFLTIWAAPVLYLAWTAADEPVED